MGEERRVQPSPAQPRPGTSRPVPGRVTGPAGQCPASAPARPVCPASACAGAACCLLLLPAADCGLFVTSCVVAVAGAMSSSPY